MKVRNKKQAMDWFLTHSSGSVTCIGADGTEADVSSYPDAVVFFNEHGQA
jgi:hypothetical protein